VEDRVIVILFPRGICSRDIISYFGSTHDQGFFKIVDSLSSVPWTIYQNAHKMAAWTGVKDKIGMS